MKHLSIRLTMNDAAALYHELDCLSGQLRNSPGLHERLAGAVLNGLVAKLYPATREVFKTMRLKLNEAHCYALAYGYTTIGVYGGVHAENVMATVFETIDRKLNIHFREYDDKRRTLPAAE